MMCRDHLVANKSALEAEEKEEGGGGLWALLTCIGFSPCECAEYSHRNASDRQWCFGNREGTAHTDRGWGDKFEEDEDDGKWMIWRKRTRMMGSG